MTTHNDRVCTFKFLNSTLIGKTNGSIDEDGTVVIDARRTIDSDDGGSSPNINDVWYRFVQAVNAKLGGLINATIPVPLDREEDYDQFDPDITSITLTQSIKGQKGNTKITRTGNWDNSITVPSAFSGGRDNPDASVLNSLEGASPEDPGIASTGILRR